MAAKVAQFQADAGDNARLTISAIVRAGRLTQHVIDERKDSAAKLTNISVIRMLFEICIRFLDLWPPALLPSSGTGSKIPLTASTTLLNGPMFLADRSSILLAKVCSIMLICLFGRYVAVTWIESRRSSIVTIRRIQAEEIRACKRR